MIYDLAALCLSHTPTPLERGTRNFASFVSGGCFLRCTQRPYILTRRCFARLTCLHAGQFFVGTADELGQVVLDVDSGIVHEPMELVDRNLGGVDELGKDVAYPILSGIEALNGYRH